MTNWHENYTVVDIETTGLSPQRDDIIELSALKVRDTKVVEEFSTLLKSSKGVNSFISGLTGITNSMLNNAPIIEDVLPEFLAFIGNDIILGHNVNFDMRFIKAKTQLVLNKMVENSIMDTMIFAKRNLELPNFKLTTIAQYYDIDTKNNHRGLKDCYITFEVYNKLRETNFVLQ